MGRYLILQQQETPHLVLLSTDEAKSFRFIIQLKTYLQIMSDKQLIKDFRATRTHWLVGVLERDGGWWWETKSIWSKIKRNYVCKIWLIWREKWKGMSAQVPPHLAYGDDGAGDVIPGLSSFSVLEIFLLNNSLGLSLWKGLTSSALFPRHVHKAQNQQCQQAEGSEIDCPMPWWQEGQYKKCKKYQTPNPANCQNKFKVSICSTVFFF